MTYLTLFYIKSLFYLRYDHNVIVLAKKQVTNDF